MMFIALGAGTVLLYAAVGAWMARVARLQPARVFQLGRYGRMRRQSVTASEWIRRYVPWGLAAGVLLILLGAITLGSQQR